MLCGQEHWVAARFRNGRYRRIVLGLQGNDFAAVRQVREADFVHTAVAIVALHAVPLTPRSQCFLGGGTA